MSDQRYQSHEISSCDILNEGPDIDYSEKCIAILRHEDGQGELIAEVSIYAGNTITFGRDDDRPETDTDGKRFIPLEDEHPVYISKEHFRIYSVVFDPKDRRVQPLIYCEDLESTNGTYVGGDCIGMIGRERVARLLHHGDLIELRPSWYFRLYQPPHVLTTEIKGKPEDLEFFQGQYSISTRMLGSGQYGKVFLAKEVASSKQVACKIIDFEEAMKNQGAMSQTSLDTATGNYVITRDKIMREIRILSELSHPHIVNLRKAFYSESTIYTFTDLAPGGDLFSYVGKSNGLLTDLESRVITRQIVSALEFMHAAGVAHRDIKLENVLITQTDFGGRVVLTDFGFASYTQADVGRMLSNVGTPGYLAPEVGRAEHTNQRYTTAADMWSLGVLTARLLIGDTIPSEDELCHSTQPDLAEWFLSRVKDKHSDLKPRASRFMQRLFVLDPCHRMTAPEALEHSWFKKPPSEAAAIEELCARITRFWRKRDSVDDVIVPLPRTLRIFRADEEYTKQPKSRRRIPDASSSPYFSLDRHIQPKVPSQRRTLLENLHKSGSQFFATEEPDVSRFQITTTHGRDMFGKVEESPTQDLYGSDPDDEISLVPATPLRPGSVHGFILSDAVDPSTSQNNLADTQSGAVLKFSSKRVRFESEDPEERSIREEVVSQGTRWQSAKAFGDALKKRKIEARGQLVRARTPPHLQTLPIRT
ncbi:serine/threonine protein kinase [Diplocarpon rosae]|nr:serine/threonine protein kinase [Diplocarpon rosae]